MHRLGKKNTEKRVNKNELVTKQRFFFVLLIETPLRTVIKECQECYLLDSSLFIHYTLFS